MLGAWIDYLRECKNEGLPFLDSPSFFAFCSLYSGQKPSKSKLISV